MKLKISLLIILITGFTTGAFSQSYKHAAGIRVGPSSPAIKSGLSYRHFLNEGTAVEGILSVSDGIGLAVLYQIHKPLSLENLNWYYGAGGYVASSEKRTYIGGAGNIGIDYRFPQLPLNISIDWKPELNIIEGFYFEGATFGFGARYIF